MYNVHICDKSGIMINVGNLFKSIITKTKGNQGIPLGPLFFKLFKREDIQKNFLKIITNYRSGGLGKESLQYSGCESLRELFSALLLEKMFFPLTKCSIYRNRRTPWFLFSFNFNLHFRTSVCL